MSLSMRAIKKFCFGTERDRRNERHLLVWCFLWMGTWLGVELAIDAGWLATGAPADAGAIAAALLGIGPFLAYRRFLREADELRRKIELEALAAAFGVGIVGGITYEFLESSTLVGSADLAHVLVAMLMAYSVGVVVGIRRYR